jgi:hypothetical protein
VKPLIRQLYFASLILIVSFAYAQTNEICDPGGINSANRQEGKIQMKAFDFIWSSHWNAINIVASQASQPSRYCVCAEVHNKSHQPLYYDWQIPARLHNEGLPYNSDGDRVCMAANRYADPPVEHDMYFGRSGDKVRTSVWERVLERRESSEEYTIHPERRGGGTYERGTPGSEQDPLEPIALSVNLHSIVFHKRQYLLFVPLPRKSERIDVSMLVRSEVISNDAGYSVHNDIKNLTPANAVFLTEVALKPRRGAGGAVPGAGGGYRWADFWSFLRSHLWPVPLPPARANFYQPEIGSQTMESRLRPELEARRLTITSPRTLPSLSFEVKVWVPGVNKEEKKASGK